MNLVYGVKDKPKFGQMLIFAFQQILAILAATIAVPSIIGNGMSQSAALFGAGVGTIVYQLFTKFRSPVFLGSSFAFIGSMTAAFAGAISTSAGYAGLLIGAAFIAIGTFISALTENQLASAVITIAVILGMVLLSFVNTLIDAYWLRFIVDWFSVLSRFNAFSYGMFDFSALLYYISITFVFLFLTVRVYEKRRWG